MASLQSPRVQKRLVLDIGSSAVRLCELVKTKTGYQVTKYFQRDIDLPPSAPEAERLERTAELANEMLKESKLRARKAVFGVPGQSVFTRTRALPPVPEHKVSQIVRYEIQQQIPFSLDQIALDYQVLSRTEAGGYDVLMAAIKVDVVEKRLDIIKKLKRSVGLVDVAPVAVYNWLKTTGEFGEQGDCVALIDFGASTTDIVIEREGQFRFTRSLNLGGNDITNAIGNTFGMEFAEAERLKRQRGFAPTGDLQRDGKGGEVVGQVLNRLVTEITRSFSYFRSQPGGGPVSRVVITGGGACLRNIVPYLQRQLNMEVRIAQPLTGLAIGPGAQAINEHPEQSAAALGLALRNCGDVPISINLIPPRIIEGARRKQQYVYWAASLAVVLAIFATIIPDMQNKIAEVERHTEMARDVIAKYDPTLVNQPTAPCQFDQQLASAQNYIRVIKQGIDRIDNYYNRRRPWLQYINTLNEARQRDPVWFTRVFTTMLTIEDARAGGAGGARGGGGGGGGGLMGRREDGDDGGGGGGGLRGAGARAGAGDEPVVRRLASSGFAGITSDRARDTAPGTMGLGRDGQAAGRRGGRAGAQQAAVPEQVPLPNGLEIHGYARDERIVLDFVTALRARDEFEDVFLDERSVNPVSVAALGRATAAGLPAAVAGQNQVVSFVILVQVSGPELNPTEIGATGRLAGVGAPGATQRDGIGLRQGGMGMRERGAPQERRGLGGGGGFFGRGDR